ncbi:MAG: iron-sulfur cluster assembly scaffold protein [Candidatus Micrarchaeia archaeon]|jgi:NifU-like protein involved in Fe-S cluster formation
MEKYNKKVMDHFLNPRNMGKMENPTLTGQAGNAVCGDVLFLYLKIEKNKEGKDIIKDVKFETFGCAAAIATSSALTEIIKGKTIEEAQKVSNKDVEEYLGQLPLIKKHCSNLAEDALKDALKKLTK